MEYSELPKVVLVFVLIGLLLGVSLIVLGASGDVARDTITVTGENETPGGDNQVTLNNQQVRDITAITNSSNTLTATTDYNASITATTTTVTLAQAYNETQLNFTYRYYSDTEATTAFDNVVTALSAISTTWLGLMITILVLALILKLVIGSFGGGVR